MEGTGKSCEASQDRGLQHRKPVTSLAGEQKHRDLCAFHGLGTGLDALHPRTLFAPGLTTFLPVRQLWQARALEKDPRMRHILEASLSLTTPHSEYAKMDRWTNM